MKLLIGIAVTLFITAEAAESRDNDVDSIERALRGTSSVSFYFVSRTEKYDYDDRKMRSEASLVVRRSCGANCDNFMEPVLANVRASRKTECMPGQQDLLVTFGHSQLVYSYGGRQAKYDGRCYFNAQNIHALIQESDFFFR